MSELEKLCNSRLKAKKLDGDKKYVDRLKMELEDIESKGKEKYFIKLAKAWFAYLQKTGIKERPVNENNLLVNWLINATNDFDIDSPPKITQGDFPDIDVDFIKEVRDYLKNDWIPKKFGESKVCNICSYTTFGLKLALQDMARVHGVDRNSILSVTKKLGKDEDGEELTWDSALRIYKEFAEYCQAHPKAADAAHRLLDRNKTFGKHAGGIIISNKTVTDTVPLLRRKGEPPSSAWVEGLNRQDLQPVGFIKFDLLVVSNLIQIAKASYIVKKTVDLIKEENNLSGICAKPGMSDWSDVPKWRNDPKSLEMANKGDLKCIFQFDSPGIRKLARDGGVTSFNDLVAYASLYRPGPLGMGMHNVYIKNKRDKSEGWKNDLHPVLEPILGDTYSVMCLHQNALVSMADGREIPIKDVIEGDLVYSLNVVKDEFEYDFVEWSGATKISDGLKITLNNGYSTITTNDHRIRTNKGWIETQNLSDHLVAVFEDGELNYVRIKSVEKVGTQQFYDLTIRDNHNFIADGIVVHNCYQEQVMKILNAVGLIPLRDCEIVRKAISKKKVKVFAEYKKKFIINGQKVLSWSAEKVSWLWDQIESFAEYGFNKSHAVAYTYISMRLLYLKAHYPKQFYSAILSVEDKSDKLAEYKREAENHGIEIFPIDINKSKEKFDIVDDKIYFGISQVKGIGEAVAKKIVAGQPYKNFEDFLQRFGTDANVVKPLIGLRCFKDADVTTLYKFSEYFKDKSKKYEDSIKRKKANLIRYDEKFSELAGVQVSLDNMPEFVEEDWKHFDIDEKNEYFKEHPCDKEEAEYSKIELQEIEEGLEVEVEKFYKKKRVLRKWNRFNELKKIWYRRHEIVAKLSEETCFEPPRLVDFDPDEWEIDPSVARDLKYEESQIKFYGFPWYSDIQRSPMFDDTLTFEQFYTHESQICPVQIKVLDCKRTTGRKGTVYYKLFMEDVNGEQQTANIWEDDFERFSDEFKVGNLLSIKLSPPEKYSTFAMKSYPRRLKPPKHQDDRVILMPKAKPKEDQIIVDDRELQEKVFDGLNKGG